MTQTLFLESVTAAAQRSSPALEESLVVSSVMEEIYTLSVQTIANIPRSVRPLLAKVLAAELNNAEEHSIWGFVRFFMFAKCVLHCPP